MKVEWAKTGELTRCNCGTPILKRVANKVLEFVKFHKGEQVKMTAQYQGYQFRIRCEKCGGNFAFIDLDDSFQIGDEVAVIKIPV